MMFWLIWNNRNAKRCGGEIIDNHLIRSKAESLIAEFRSAQVSLRKPSVAVTRAVRWIPPEPPSYKINFDRAVFKELCSAGLGVVVRDFSGRVIGALVEKIPLPNVVATVEALACRRAMFFAKELGLFDCVFEGDAEVIVKPSRGKIHRTQNTAKSLVMFYSLPLTFVYALFSCKTSR